MATKGKRVKPTYNDQFRASAVVMLKSQGYPEMKGALSMVAKHLKVPARTLSRWFNGEQNPPPDYSVNEKTFDMRAAIQTEMVAIIGDMPGARKDATYPQLGTVYGILFDKSRLLDNLPTEIVGVLPQIMTAIDKRGLKASDVFNAMLEELETADNGVNDGSSTRS